MSASTDNWLDCIRLDVSPVSQLVSHSQSGCDVMGWDLRTSMPNCAGEQAAGFRPGWSRRRRTNQFSSHLSCSSLHCVVSARTALCCARQSVKTLHWTVLVGTLSLSRHHTGTFHFPACTWTGTLEQPCSIQLCMEPGSHEGRPTLRSAPAHKHARRLD